MIGSDVAIMINKICYFGISLQEIAEGSGVDLATLKRITADKKCDRKTAKKLLKFCENTQVRSSNLAERFIITKGG